MSQHLKIGAKERGCTDQSDLNYKNNTSAVVVNSYLLKDFDTNGNATNSDAKTFPSLDID